MRLSKMVGQRIKETPRDASIPSHIYLIRGGYVRPVSAGIYSLLPLGQRICSRIEELIRAEMNKLEGQEVKLPVVLPEELWEESGRAQAMGPELLRFSNRNENPMILGMTHEEAVVHLVRTEVNSYKQLPFMVYQIQTKYRDEARPRGGLIRVREFTMKDAYSFHSSRENMEEWYERVKEAYERLFRRIGLTDVVTIKSDTGMMGGSESHEMLALADCGEDMVAMSPDGEYCANLEIATADLEFTKEEPQPLEKVHTPEQKTIQGVASYVGVPESKTAKAVFYADENDGLIFVQLRGDLDVNESKLQKVTGASALEFASDEGIRAAGAEPGYASPMDLDENQVKIVVDPSAAESNNLVVGANEPDYHYRNYNYYRDANVGEVADVAMVREGDPCPVTGKPLELRRGIEVGNIFQLGTKYSESMNCEFLDENGKKHPMVMGCYGIGVGRTMAAVIEQSHDDYGPIWPMSIAPYQVHICALDPGKKGVGDIAERIYKDLLEEGIEVLFDDRGEKAGFMFNDADLIGIPLRLIVSPKNVDQNQVEFKTRDGTRREFVSLDEVTAKVKQECEAAGV